MLKSQPSIDLPRTAVDEQAVSGESTTVLQVPRGAQDSSHGRKPVGKYAEGLQVPRGAQEYRAAENVRGSAGAAPHRGPDVTADPAVAHKNVLTIDLEDWIQSVYDHDHPLTDCFRKDTHQVLELLDRCSTRATFFVLGLAAEKAPVLIREVQAAGHEIQSHGYGHRLVHRQSPSEFRDDVHRAKRLLEDITGREVAGYRAPAFSIGPRTPWALDVLAECGHRWDSSLFPVRTRRYGSFRNRPFPHVVTTVGGNRIAELPVASFRFGPVRLPIGGGGYLRLLPASYFCRGIRQLNDAGHPAVLYVHPYEFAPEEFGELPLRIPRLTRLAQGLGRGRLPGRLARILSEFRFGRASEMLSCYVFPSCPVTRR